MRSCADSVPDLAGIAEPVPTSHQPEPETPLARLTARVVSTLVQNRSDQLKPPIPAQRQLGNYRRRPRPRWQRTLAEFIEAEPDEVERLLTKKWPSEIALLQMQGRQDEAGSLVRMSAVEYLARHLDPKQVGLRELTATQYQQPEPSPPTRPTPATRPRTTAPTRTARIIRPRPRSHALSSSSSSGDDDPGEGDPNHPEPGGTLARRRRS